MNNEPIISVIGGGSWPTALVKILTENVERLNWYIRSKSDIDHLKKHGHNPRYLSQATLDTSKIHFYDDIEKTIEESDILIFAIPSAFLKDAMQDIKADFKDKFVISAIKGIVPDDYITVAEYFNQYFKVPFKQIGIITGPCHAEEVAMERLSYLTVACDDQENGSFIAEKLNTFYIKTTTASDIYGTEYSAVIKNIVAIASGICHGLGYGDNFQAVLVSNAIQEIKRFLDNTYPSERKINGSAYLGDLLVTAYSQFSRNRTFGNMVGKGYSVKSAQLEMNMIAEGYYAAYCINEINKKYQVDLPICHAVYNILYENISPQIEIKLLSEHLK